MGIFLMMLQLVIAFAWGWYSYTAMVALFPNKNPLTVLLMCLPVSFLGGWIIAELGHMLRVSLGVAL